MILYAKHPIYGEAKVDIGPSHSPEEWQYYVCRFWGLEYVVTKVEEGSTCGNDCKYCAICYLYLQRGKSCVE